MTPSTGRKSSHAQQLSITKCQLDKVNLNILVQSLKIKSPHLKKLQISPGQHFLDPGKHTSSGWEQAVCEANTINCCSIDFIFWAHYQKMYTYV